MTKDAADDLTPGPPEVTPLQERLAKLIRAHGPISLADYMADALGHPQEGYYMTQAPLGATGDFTTAPEVSQMFGELIGAWLVQSWIDIGEPSLFQLVELGPGRGALMADILRTAKLRPDFRKAARVAMVESSGRMRHAQQRALVHEDVEICWRANLSETPPGPMLLVANEFFDCMPVRQFVKTEDVWRERLVGLKDPEGDNDELAYYLSAQPVDARAFVPEQFRDAPDRSVFEVNAAGAAITDEIAHRLQEFKGRALIIDYGHAPSRLGDTVQAVRRHRYWPPLASPGLADITAHVDFGALANAAKAAGARVDGPISQGALLMNLGVEHRAARLAELADAGDVEADMRRLVARDQMGEVFKALCISHPALDPPPAF